MLRNLFIILLLIFIWSAVNCQVKTQNLEIQADNVYSVFDEGKPISAKADGNVTCNYKGIKITAQKAEVDFKNNKAVFSGGITIDAEGQIGKGNSITLNTKTGEWQLVNADTDIVPNSQNYLLDKVYLKARQISGLKQNSLISDYSELTTCNLDHPHYIFRAKKISVYKDDKIVFENVSLVAGNIKLISLQHLVIPIDQNYSSRIIPEVGMSAEEGFFLKTVLPYGNKDTYGSVLVDLMSKKGIGTGINHSYISNSSKGNLHLYFIKDQNINQDTFTGQFSHQQKIGEFKANIASDFRSNSYYYAPKSTSIINSLSISNNITSFTINNSINKSYSDTTSIIGVLTDNRKLSSSSSLLSTFNYNEFDTSNFETKKLNSEVIYSKTEKKYDWNLDAAALTDLTDKQFQDFNGYQGIEKLPELSIVSDTARLGANLPFGIPARIKFSYGLINELPVNFQTDRIYFDIATPIIKHSITNTWDLSLGSQFRQYVYGNDIAQFAINQSAELSKTIGKDSSIKFNYRFQRPYGATPFRFDYIGRYNNLRAMLNINESKILKLSVIGGYNFEQMNFPWQDATFRLTFAPSPSVYLYTSSGYDLNQHKLRNIVNQLKLKANDRFDLQLGTRYDPQQGKLADARGKLDAKIDSKTKIQALAGYNGFTDTFDYRALMITRDLHCWEASLVYQDQTGFYENKSIMLNLRIKAFPAFQSFGAGIYGEDLGSSVGEVY